jgi:hypothetical protein
MAIGLGTSAVQGVQGKGAAKEQRKQADQQMALQRQLLDMQRPFLQNQLDVSNYSVDALSRNLNPLLSAYMSSSQDADKLGDQMIGRYDELMGDALGRENQLYGQGQNLMNSSLGYLDAAGRGLGDVQNFYRSFMDSGQRAIDRFLPSAQRTFENIAPEIGNINQGYQSANENIARFAPRGGGRVSSMAKANTDRQKQISDQFFQSRQNTQNQGLQAAFQGAAGQGQTSNSLANLYQSALSGGLNTIGTGSNYLTSRGGLAQNAFAQGLNAKNLSLNNKQGMSGVLQSLMGVPGSSGQSIPSLYGTQANLSNAAANRAYGSDANQKQGSGLGGYLVDLFNNKGVQGKIDGLLGGLFGKGSSGMTLGDFNMD